MADEVIKSLAVRISGDLSDLEAALQRVPSMVQEASAALSSSLTSATEGATSAFASLGGGVDGVAANLAALSSAISTESAATQEASTMLAAMGLATKEVGDAAAAASAQLSLFDTAVTEGSTQLDLFDMNSIAAADAMVQVGDGVAAAGGHVESFTEEVEHNKAALEELGQGLTQVGKGLLVTGAALVELTEHFSELAGESVTLASNLKFSETALTAFFGSAEKTKEVLEGVKGIADSSVFSFPELLGATQKLANFTHDAGKTEEALRAAAMAAEAVGGASASIDLAVASLIKLNDGGQLNARTLRALGLTTSDVAKQMESAGNTFDAVLAAIKLKDEELYNALGNQYPVQLNKLKTAWEEVLVTMGQSLVPAATSALNALKPVIALAQEGAEWFGQLPAPVKDLAIILGGLAVATGPVVLGLGAMTFAVGELIEGVPKVMAALAKLTAENEATAVSAGEAAVALEAEGAAAAGAAPEIAAAGEAAAGSAVGWKTLGLAVGFYGAVGAVGYGIGDFLAAQSRKGSDALNELQEAAAKLGVNLHQQSLSGDELSGALAKLEAMAKKLGITMAQGDQSNQEFIATLIKAITVHNQATESTEKHSAALQKLEDEQSNANAKLKEAKEALDLVKASFDGSKDSQDLLNRATDEYTKALAGAHPVIKQVTEAVSDLEKAENKAFEEAFKLTSEIPANMADFVAGIQKGMNFNEVETSLNKLVHTLQTSANASKEEVQALIENIQGQADALKGFLDEYKTGVESIIVETDKQNVAYTKALATYTTLLNSYQQGIALSNGQVATLQQLAAGYAALQKAGNAANGTVEGFAAALGKQAGGIIDVDTALRNQVEAVGMLGKVQPDLTVAIGATADASTKLNKALIENHSTVMNYTVPDATAARLAVSEWDDETVALGRDLEGATGKVTVFRAAAEGLAAQTGKLNDALVFTNKTWKTQAEAIAEVNKAHAAAASAMQAATGAAKNLSYALSNLSSETAQVEQRSKDEVAGINEVVTSLDHASDVATKAAAAFDKAWAAMGGAPDSAFSFGGDGSLNGKSFSAGSTLGMYAAAGALSSTLDQLAQSMGLMKVGEGQYEDLATFNAGLKAANAGFQYVFANGNFQIVYDNANASVNKQTAATTKQTVATQDTTAATQSATAANHDLAGVSAGLSNIFTDTGAAAADASAALGATGDAAADSGVVWDSLNGTWKQTMVIGTDLNGAFRSVTESASTAAEVMAKIADDIQRSSLGQSLGPDIAQAGAKTQAAVTGSALPVWDAANSRFAQTIQTSLGTLTETGTDFQTVVKNVADDIKALSTGHTRQEFDIALSGAKALDNMSSAFPVFDTQTNKWVQTVQLGLRTITESAADFNTVVAKIGADITAASTGHVAGEFDIPLSGPKSSVSTSTVKQGPTLDQQVANLSAGLTAMGAQPVQSVSIVVSGNTILDDPTAKALANRMMDAAVSRLRTGAGLLR